MPTMKCFTVKCSREATVRAAGHQWCPGHAGFYDRAEVCAYDEKRKFPKISAVHAARYAPVARPRELFPALGAMATLLK